MSEDKKYNAEDYKPLLLWSPEQIQAYVDGLIEGLKLNEEFARRIADEVKKSLEES